MNLPRFLLFVALLLASHPLYAQDASAPTGFRGEFLGLFEMEAGKIAQLASAVPEDKYSWRPAEGVRSVAEVYMHIAGANEMFASMISGEEIDLKAVMAKEKSTTAKADIEKHLAASIEKVKETVKKMSDADLEKSVTISFIPLTTSARGVLLIVMSHVSEHLGQSIAYARSNNITPPWTAKENTGSGY